MTVRIVSFNSSRVLGLFYEGKALERASQQPFILEIEEFNLTANPELVNFRWERWITVMAYSNATGLSVVFPH